VGGNVADELVVQTRVDSSGFEYQVQVTKEEAAAYEAAHKQAAPAKKP